MAQSRSLVLLVLGICVWTSVQGTFYPVDVRYTVKLDMYSGNDDSEWTIGPGHQLYGQLAHSVNHGPPTSMFTGLGYRGFIVQARNAFGQSAWKTVGRHTNRQLETLLLQTRPDNTISLPAYNHIRSCIYGQVPTMNGMISIKITTEEKKKRRKKRQAQIGGRRCNTRFEPGLWNNGRVQARNNCYNYATNRITNTFAQPGRGSGRRFTRREATDVYQACLRDGLTELAGPRARFNECLVALFIWPGEDYHFFRLDSNGLWSQKSGRTEARAVDDSGRRIIDPRTADRGPYTVFAGWLGVGPNIAIN